MHTLYLYSLIPTPIFF